VKEKRGGLFIGRIKQKNKVSDQMGKRVIGVLKRRREKRTQRGGKSTDSEMLVTGNRGGPTLSNKET